MSNFFSGTTSVRALLPPFAPTGDVFIWDNFPDTTLGGVVTGLTQTNLGDFLVKHFKSQAQLSLPNIVCSAVSTAPGSLDGDLNGVVLGSDGNLYGTTDWDGAYGYGTVFQATTSGGFTVLHSFGKNTDTYGNPLDGGNPGGLVLGSDGYLYGTTSYGGTGGSGNGTIFKITTTGSLTSVYTFGAGDDHGSGGGNPMVLGKDGNLYGATQFGGDNEAGIIFEFTLISGNGQSKYSFTTLGSFPSIGSTFGANSGSGALIQGTDGNFYGVTQFGGSGAGSIFQFIPNGQDNGTFNSYPIAPQQDQYGNPITLGISSLVQASNGVFYGTAQYGGNNFGNGSGGEGDGFLFCVDLNGFTNLYSFDEDNFDGYGPIGAMVQGTNGAFYGITSSGGANGKGTIFKFTPGAAAPDFVVWFNSNLGVQHNDQDSGDYYDGTVYAGLIKAPGRIYGTAHDGVGGDKVFSLSDGVNPLLPYIVTSPASSTDSLGSTVSLSVVASGTGTLTYQWVKGTTTVANSGTHVTGATSANLTLTGLTSADAGSYYVVVANTIGKATSAVAVLTVALPPTITSQPATPVNIAQGGTLSLTVGAGGGGPFTYQWLLNTVPLSDDEFISGSATANLVIAPVSVNNSGSYSVVVANATGSTNSKISVVTVGVPPSIVTSPANTTNLVGSTVTLTVTASGTGLGYQWSKGSAPVVNSGTHVTGATTASLTLAGLTSADSGLYSVVVTNLYGSAPRAQAVLTVLPLPTGVSYYSLGTNYLAYEDPGLALADFTIAAPTNQYAAVYLALTRMLALPNDSAASNFLNNLGVSAAGRNIYQWRAKPNANANGHTVLPTTLNVDAFPTEARTDIVPTLIASETNLAKVTDTTFTLFMPRSVTHFGGDVTLDYGDVQMLRAMADAATVFGYEINTVNLNANYGAASNIVKTDGSINAVLTNYPALLAITNTGDFALARAAFTSAVTRYMAASAFIRARPAGGLKYLFNLDANDLNDEQNFRTLLSDLQSSLNAPFGGPGADANAIADAKFFRVISDFTNHTISLGNLFSGSNSVRSLLPTQTANRVGFIWDSFPDTTLGGVITGLTQTNLGKVFLKDFHEQSQLDVPTLIFTVVSVAGSSFNQSSQNGQGMLNGAVLGNDGNFYGTMSSGGDNGTGAFFKATPNAGFTLLYSFGNYDTNDNPPPNGGNPSSVVLGTNGDFYGTTSYGGTNGNGNGTIFRITASGSLKTVYTFGDQDNTSTSGGNPLVLAKDGNFYGATQYGGDNGQGIIFEFTPPTGSETEGTFTVLGSFPSVNVSNPMAYGSGAGALIQGADGYFYGVTQFGGDDGAGSIFQFIPSGVDNGTFHSGSFPQMNGPNGQITPGINTLVQASNGLFYGASQYGGNNFGNGSGGQGDGFLFCFDTNGNFTNLYSFDEDHFHGFGPIGAMVQGTNGAFYGITSSGGANQDGTIFKFTPGAAAPEFIVWFDEALGKQQSEQNGYYHYNNNTVNVGLFKANGTIYGMAPNDGPAKNDNGTLFSIAANNNIPPSIVSSPASTNRASGSAVTLSVSASGPGTLTYKWVKGTTTVANSGTHITGATTANLTLTGLLSTDAGSYYAVVANTYGKATSAVAVLTVILPATITNQPAPIVNIRQGGTVSLTVGAGGTGPFTYQWRSNNVALSDGGNISGSLTSNLTILSALTTESASYSVIVSNSISSTNSHASVVTVGTPPEILASPANATNVAGRTATLTVTASGGGLSYKWIKGTTPVANSSTHITGATSNILTFTGLLLTDAGSYFAVVTNTYGKATSAVAVLTVVQGPTITSQPATPVSIVQGEPLRLTVGATGGSLTWQWLSNNAALSDGGNVFGSATSNLVISPAVTNDSANYSVIVSNSISSTNSHFSVVTVAVDKALPAVTITNRYSGYPRLSAPVTFGGAASELNPKGNVPITNVNYWITNLNGAFSAPVQGPFAANLTAGLTSAAPSNWTASVLPPAGSNIFAVQAVDFSGNLSPFASNKFFLKSPAMLTVITNAGSGFGSVTGTAPISGDAAPSNNAALNVGEAYSITEHASNSFFGGWTLSCATAIGATTNPTLNFIMESNATITANFITNIFIGMAGTYNGLFPFDAQGVTENTAGMIGNLVVSNTGFYTGKLYLAGASAYSLATPASFTHGGYATNVVATTSALGKVEVVMYMNAGSAPRTITGFVVGTNPATGPWTSGLYLVASASPASNRLDAPNYTLLIPPAAPSPIPVTTPTGYGYALLTNYPGSATVPGSVTFKGALADGQAFSQNVPIAEDNMIPVCIYPYTPAAPGLLFGRLNLSSTPALAGLAPAPSGDLTWIKQASTSGLFKAGFTNTSLAVLGSPWSNSVPLGTIDPGSQLILSNGSLTQPLTYDVSVSTVSKTNLVTTPPTNTFSASVNTNTGQLTVTVTNGTGAGKVILNGRGAVLQDSGSGGGYFLLPSATTTNAGSIWLQSPP